MAFKNMTLRGKFALIFAVIVFIFFSFTIVAVYVQHIGIILGISALAIILILIMLSILLRNVADPAAQLAELIKNPATGDELAQLSAYLAHAKDTQIKLQEARQTIMDHEKELEGMSNFMEKLVNGELSAMRMGYGQSSRHVAAAFVLARTLHEIVADIHGLATSAASGDFKKRISSEKYGGDWQKLAHGMNTLIEAVAEPIIETKEAMDAIATGKLYVKVSAGTKGDLLKLKTSANNATTALAKYVDTIVKAIENIDKRSRFSTELSNDFAPIKAAITVLGDNMSKDTGAATGANARTTMGAALNRQSLASRTNATRDTNAPKKLSGAAKIDGLAANSDGGTPSYMRTDFGKY